ncbi:hypothetical protein D3C80_2052040 [compost metagenome]
MRRDRLAGELSREVDRHRVARLIRLFVGGDRYVDLRRDNLDAGVLETVLAALGVEHRESQVWRETVFHRDPRAVLRLAEFFQLQPVAAL